MLAAEPFVGTWKLQPAKSSGALPRDETVVIRERGRFLTVEVTIVDSGPRNSTFSISYTVPINGGLGHIEKGPYDGVSIKRISPNAIETTYMTGGKEARSTRAVVSRDGKTITSTGKAVTPGDPGAWIMVFEKQQISSR
jgi:hypothetical protein